MTSDSYSLFNPDPVLVLIGLTVSLLLGLYQLYGMGDEAAKQANRRKRMLKADGAAGKLKTHCHAHFGEKKFVRVADKVYIAVGYGASNCIFIEGSSPRNFGLSGCGLQVMVSQVPKPLLPSTLPKVQPWPPKSYERSVR